MQDLFNLVGIIGSIMGMSLGAGLWGGVQSRKHWRLSAASCGRGSVKMGGITIGGCAWRPHMTVRIGGQVGTCPTVTGRARGDRHS